VPWVAPNACLFVQLPRRTVQHCFFQNEVKVYAGCRRTVFRQSRWTPGQGGASGRCVGWHALVVLFVLYSDGSCGSSIVYTLGVIPAVAPALFVSLIVLREAQCGWLGHQVLRDYPTGLTLTELVGEVEARGLRSFEHSKQVWSVKSARVGCGRKGSRCQRSAEREKAKRGNYECAVHLFQLQPLPSLMVLFLGSPIARIPPVFCTPVEMAVQCRRTCGQAGRQTTDQTLS
jgi:hypothetical protein